MKAAQLFVYSAGALLFVTSAAKVISALGDQAILHMYDPVVGLSFRNLFLVAAGIEATVVFVCFFGKRTWLSSLLVAWLATNFLAYRVGMVLVGYHQPCSCMGTLTDMLRVSPQTADMIMKIILAYLLIGSYGILFRQWWINRKLAAGKAKSEPQSRQTGFTS